MVSIKHYDNIISCQRSKFDHMIFVKANFKEGIPCCYVRRQDIDVIMQSKLPQHILLNADLRFISVGLMASQVSDDFSVNENISQFDIKTLIKDCFGLVILRSSKFLKPFLNMISERLFIMTVQYFGIPHT